MDFQVLNLLLKCGMDFGHKRIRNRGLSDTECLICSYVYSHPGCSQDDAVQGLRMDKTTLAKALRTLEDKGCVERTQDAQDRRKNVLKVTQSGAERISEIAHLHDRWLSGILETLNPEERSQFESYCARLLEAAEKQLSEQDKP